MLDLLFEGCVISFKTQLVRVFAKAKIVPAHDFAADFFFPSTGHGRFLRTYHDGKNKYLPVPNYFGINYPNTVTARAGF